GLNFSSVASAIFSPEQKDVWLTRMQWLFGQSQKGWSWETFMRHAAPVFIKAFQDEDIDYRTTPVTGDLEEESDPVDEDSADLEFAPPRESPSKLGRNDPCHCGSGKKYKKCCLSKDEEGRPKERLFERAAKHHLIYSADQFPVERCLINENWKKSRLAQIVVTREFEPGLLLYGVYLADLGCMGIKSSFCNVGFTIEEFETTLMVKLFGGQTMIPIGVQYAKEIIVGALNYADALGIKPDPDFELARHVLGKEPVAATHNVQFGGDDGKPLFVAGPRDDANKIIQQLTQKLGKDGFHFIAPVNLQ